MYKFQSKQTTIFDFQMPLGMELDPKNRWVLKAATIPWDEIEVKYAALFADSKYGNVAYPLRLALGALLIKATLGFSDEELVLQIQENPYLQYFCGLPGYTNKRPFEQSTVTLFRKRLTDTILGEINEMLIAKSLNKDKKPNNTKPTEPPTDTPPKNKGTLILDSTCVPQNIRFPLDLSLLDEARRKLESMIDYFHEMAGGDKPRMYRREARKEYVNVAKKKQKTAKEIRKAVGKQLNYVARDIKYVKRYLQRGLHLSYDNQLLFSTILKLHAQQQDMYNRHEHQVKNRIVSIRQPWVRPIVRGKARAKVEFGAKIDVNVHKGFVRLGHKSYDAYNESENLISEVEQYRKREGHYPKRVLADQIYRNKEVIMYCAKRGIEILGKALGRPKKNNVNTVSKYRIRKSEIDRIEVERKIGLAKGSYSMGLLRTKLQNTSFTMIAVSILAMNVAYATRLLFVFIKIVFKKYKNMIENIYEWISYYSNIWCIRKCWINQ